MKQMDLKLLSESIRGMKTYSPIYKVLKAELSLLGYWRNKPRGNPAKGFQVMKGKGGN